MTDSASHVAPSARRIAYEVLSSYDATRAAGDRSAPHITQLLEERLNAVAPSPVERRLAMELTYGIIRRRATLDALVAAFVTRQRAQIEDGLWLLLQLGAYQLTLMSSIPPHAAVSETVQLARRLRRESWSGFINGVLRSISRDLTDEFSDQPTVDAVPVISLPAGNAEAIWPPPTVQFRRLRRALFPDPQTEPAAWLATAGSYPRWLADRWQNAGRGEEALRLAAWFNTPGRLTLRVNPLRSSPAAVRAALEEQGIAVAPGEFPESLRLGRSARIEDLPGFSEGWFSVQDESAQAAARLLDPQPGATVLDLCAAPGSKTTHLAELMGDRGRIVACDIHAQRISRVAESCRRLGLASIETQIIRPTVENAPSGPFDAALVDVPCSNTGVLGKRPDARWRITPQDLVDLPQLQRRLLMAASDRVRPGGRIVYSTCSIEADENERLVNTVLQERPDLELVSERRHRPGEPADGGYLALLRRRDSSLTPPPASR